MTSECTWSRYRIFLYVFVCRQCAISNVISSNTDIFRNHHRRRTTIYKGARGHVNATGFYRFVCLKIVDGMRMDLVHEMCSSIFVDIDIADFRLNSIWSYFYSSLYWISNILIVKIEPIILVSFGEWFEMKQSLEYFRSRNDLRRCWFNRQSWVASEPYEWNRQTSTHSISNSHNKIIYFFLQSSDQALRHPNPILDLQFKHKKK